MSDERRARILLVDDEELNREYLSELLEEEGFPVETASDGMDALEKLRGSAFDILITDKNMPRLDGLKLLARVAEEDIPVTSLMITAFGDVDSAVEAMRLGASNYIEKPTGGGMGPRLLLAVEQALDRHQLARRTRSLEVALQPNAAEQIIGESKAMKLLRKQCEKLGSSGKTVLIQGETGTGKEVVARSIHLAGSRRDKPFVAINCAALNRELLTSELFGHVKGAFSGAVSDRPGKFEAASEGTLFLDEIGEMDLELQSKFLRVIELQEFERVGSNESIRVDVRILAATNRDLIEEIEKESFREDLYHRLNVIGVETTPLRNIPSDIPVLSKHFLACDPEGRGLDFSEEAIEKLKSHAWPGNIRELKHIVEQAVFYAEGDLIEAEDVILPQRSPKKGGTAVSGTASLEEIERDLIEQRLQHFRNNKRETARSLGIGESTLYKKIKDYDLG
ncbi:MAG: sigma-54 dependent transcriptional regulator [Candidatus Krumholzibacteria bacterium]|jgi:DNA-binding NtrC family response regulator|nr:sigma-54 dependent transcriptional regulator [Candidatus Krumholzibacteria bacterium]MDP6669068.1 sigma-54 dependent transcriptional regulator [Candidatus Krumholzibacteria bacterium]MDP6797184.1 sigma-54 dependent transcriptional regulator [Candidatus Krumholzibacteria bacterium]MDP7021471.1 sigma-54 dependent transcriptional regulator [Candidatus Krumholzibacteria bacterium]